MTDRDSVEGSTPRADAAPGRINRRQFLGAGMVSGTAAALMPDTASRAARAGPDAGVADGPISGDVPPPQAFDVVNVLPPGESGFYPVLGQVAGELRADPASFGANVDSQRELYWNFEYKPGNFETPSGAPDTPAPGVRIYRGAYGVPLIYGDDAYAVWFGVGYAAAQDRLFQLDAIRRLSRGTLAELTGPSAVPADIQVRVVSYSEAEYDEMFATVLNDDDRIAADGCIAGVNAWIDAVSADPAQLPAEYALLTSLPQPVDRRDLMAVGVYMTRNIASAGGDEFGNVANLLALEAHHGSATGRAIFDDLYWLEDTAAFTTLPASEGEFPNGTLADDPVNGFDYAAGLPMALASGPGTGAAPTPPVPGGLSGLPAGVQASLAEAVASLQAWAAGLHGGSYQIAIAPERSANGKPLLVNGPQLGYAYPSELYEVEVHGGGYDVRGVTVAGVPVVGIGYGTRHAWGLTTGLSKTIDTFIETTRANPVPGAPAQYLHDGVWKDLETRTETIVYRAGEDGVPVGPPVFSEQITVSRTVHGPVVATTADGTRAASLQFAMWGVEVATLSGILMWNRAQSFEDFEAGVAAVTWNENTLYADADGTIAYWHPGRFPVRAPGLDWRFPTPGTGPYDWQGFLPFSSMPHARNPAQGYLCNWNTKPAVGWLFGSGDAPPELPAGYACRTRDIADQVATRHDITFADLVEIDRTLGVKDHRARDFQPLLAIAGALAGANLSDRARQALELIGGWDGSAYGPGADTSPDGATDGPAPTIFAAVMSTLIELLLGPSVPPDLLANLSITGEHTFDVTPIYNVALRALDPSLSSIPLSFDFLGGRTGTGIVIAALDQALASLATQFKTEDMTTYRRPHPTSSINSLTGIVGPSVTMPFVDRGTYIHLVGFR